MKQKFDVTGMTCSACSAHVEKAVSKLAGVSQANVSLLLNNMTVEYDEGQVRPQDIVSAVEKAGYGARPESEDAAPAPKPDLAGEEARAVKVRLWVSFLCLIPLMTLSMGHMVGLTLPGAFGNPLVMALTQLLLTLPVAYVNRKYYQVGFKALFHRSPNMDSLIAIGSSAALVYGVWTMYAIALSMGSGDMARAHELGMELYFESAAMILTLITLGKYLEARSKGKTSQAIAQLLDLAPKTATVEVDGREEIVPVERVKVGDVVLIRPGEAVSVDGEILSGTSAIDQSALTGESIPVDKGPGDEVNAGTINKTGFLRVRALRESGETTLSQIVKLVEEAGSSKAPIGRLADKISGVFVPVVMSIAAVAVAGWLIAGEDISFALSIGISVLVISCPCALGLATPVAIMAGTGKGASLGILFKSAEALEQAHAIGAAVLDKTGTLTEGRPRVTRVIAAKGAAEEELLQAAVSLEKPSEHPLAEAIVEYAQSRGARAGEVEGFEAVSGRGVRGKLDGRAVLAGNRAMLTEAGVAASALYEAAEALAEAGETPMFFARDGAPLGLIAAADEVKPSSAQAVRELNLLGVRTVMLTGDNQKTAAAIARKLGIAEVQAEVLPQDKERVVRQIQEEGVKCAMVGDGINDAPALARADVGIAIGAGTDIAIESADVVLMKSDLMDAATAIRLSRAVLRNIKENLFWAFFYNSVGIPLAAGLLYPAFGLKLNPMIGAAAMSLSSVCVVLNALRLTRFREKRHEVAAPANAGALRVETPEQGKPQIEREEEPPMTSKVLTIEGMTCGHCKAHVEKALNGIEGAKATVDLQKKQAVVTMERPVDDNELKTVVADAGYEVTKIQ